FHAENEGQTVITAEYEDYRASRKVDVSTTLVEDIRHATHSDYTRVVLDLSRTNDNYELHKDEGQLEIRIPYAEIAGVLDKDGGTFDVKGSPVLSSIEYLEEDDEFIAVHHLKHQDVEYDT